MTFEGFDAAPLIEAAGFSPDMLAMARAAPADDAGTLDAALREAARAERAAVRAELFVADLWIGHGDARGLGAAERPGLEAGASWRALMPLLDDALIELPGGKDGPLRAAYGEKEGEGEGEKEEEIVVKGSKPNTMDEGDSLDGIPNGDNGGGEQSGGVGGSLGNPPEFPHTDKSACADGAAVSIAEKIKELLGSISGVEYGAMISKNSDGTFGADNGIHTDYSPASARLGAPSNAANIHGPVHNHPFNSSDYNDNFQQRYPGDGDWAALDRLVAMGADPSTLSTYILDPFGELREFRYADKAYYQSQGYSARALGEGLPAATKACGAG